MLFSPCLPVRTSPGPSQVIVTRWGNIITLIAGARIPPGEETEFVGKEGGGKPLKVLGLEDIGLPKTKQLQPKKNKGMRHKSCVHDN